MLNSEDREKNALQKHSKLLVRGVHWEGKSLWTDSLKNGNFNRPHWKMLGTHSVDWELMLK